MLVAVVIPDTSTGGLVENVVPSPRWPPESPPQHLIAPPVSRAHEWWPPAATLVAVVIPGTSTGVAPYPIDPKLDSPPQHLIVPPVSRAHAW